MSVEANSAERGSSKLFAIATGDREALAKAIGLARADYEVKWWWKYGTPAFIDLLRLTLEVDSKSLGNTVSQFMQQNSRELQVTAECFPYGITQPDRYRLELNIQNRV